jgi:hypothetical protein
MNLLRRLRAIVSTAILWTLVWIPVGLVFGMYRYLTHPHGGHGFDERDVGLGVIWSTAWPFGIWGAISGALYAIILSLAERRRPISELSPRRVGAWGALGALALPGVVIVINTFQAPGYAWIPQAAVFLFVTSLLGAGCAAGTLRLAQRLPKRLMDGTPSSGSLTSA